MIVAILPARGGSKRIKNKNIINIGGKPMIHHTIQILKKTKIFDEIIVTTDSSRIQNISKKAGAKIYFTRPKNLSNDHVGAFEVINHTINFLKNRARLNIHRSHISMPNLPTNLLSVIFTKHFTMKNFDFEIICFRIFLF